MKLLQTIAVGICSLVGAATCLAKPPKVIIDTDFNTIGDDGQVAVMAAQLYARGDINLLGFTVVSGNGWRDQEVVDCLKAVERLGINQKVGVYVGAQYPLLHDYTAYLLEQTLFGNATDYVGAYSTTQPGPDQLTPPPDGYATQTVPQRQNAVQFLIQTIHRYPREVTVLALGPMTNLALAMREDPSIVPLIKQIVIMGGQIYAAGNAYNDAGEFNWWFDPESVQVVLRSPVPKLIIPLDVTNTVKLPKKVYNQIVNHRPATPITPLFKQAVHPGDFIYDTIAFSSLIDPTLDTDVRTLYVDMNTNFDANYGKSLVWSADPYPGTQVESVSRVVFRIDNSRFFDLYADLLTRPVPVVFTDGNN